MTGQVADVSEVGLTERIANINIYMQEHMGLTLSIGNSDFIETKCNSQGGLLNGNSIFCCSFLCCKFKTNYLEPWKLNRTDGTINEQQRCLKDPSSCGDC